MSMDRRSPPVPPCLVLFDGVCTACNRFVSFLLRRTPDAALFFVPSQSEAGRELMRHYQIRDEDVNRTVFVIEGKQLFSRSCAVLRLASRLPFPWRLASALRLIPVSLRDAVYQFVAAHRYRWFGKQLACRIPTVEERARFIQTREELEAHRTTYNF